MGEYAEYEIEKSESLNDDDFDFEHKKQKRKYNTEWSTNYLIKKGIKFQSKNGGSHLVLDDYDFWPATGLFINKKTKQKFRGVRNLVNKLLRRNDMSEHEKYRKKPIVIDAYQWKQVSEYKEGVERDVDYYRTPDLDGQNKCSCCSVIMHYHGWIDNSQGGYIVCPNDYIITGIDGKKYPCKPDIFLASYESVNEDENRKTVSEKISLSQMFKKIGNENLKFQMLGSSLIKVYQKKDHAEITFGTQAISATEIAIDSGRVGMIVWVERKDYDKFVKENIK